MSVNTSSNAPACWPRKCASKSLELPRPHDQQHVLNAQNACVCVVAFCVGASGGKTKHNQNSGAHTVCVRPWYTKCNHTRMPPAMRAPRRGPRWRTQAEALASDEAGSPVLRLQAPPGGASPGNLALSAHRQPVTQVRQPTECYPRNAQRSLHRPHHQRRWY